jgi:hypothetical protein
MKNHIQISMALIVFSLLACNETESSNQNDSNGLSTEVATDKEWTELKCGLYINSKGDIAFPTEPDIVFIPHSKLEDERSMCPNNFLTTFGYDDTLQLKNVVDVHSFEPLGPYFYRDKNNIYSHYAVCDAGYFQIFVHDTTTFKVFGGYATYKGKVYQHRKGPIEADGATFKVFEGIDHVAKDKDGFFSFGERISEEELRNEIGEALFIEKIEL